MTRIDIHPRFVLDYTVGRYRGQVEVVTKDIGATIGTEILDEDGIRICAYRPGTRYPSTAEECAEKHLRQALELLIGSSLPDAHTMPMGRAVATALRAVVAGEQPWNPDDEEENDQW
jgi:hypothetical protein